MLLAFLRKRVRLVIYLDDFLIMNEAENGARADLKFTLEILEALGFLMNWDKFVTTPLNSWNIWECWSIQKEFPFLYPHQGHRCKEYVQKSLI